MAELTDADLIWNRACGDDKLRTLPGDCALVNMLRAHNLTMNGGVLHAVECLTADELSAAHSGYRFYGFEKVPSLLARARALVEAGRDTGDDERQLNTEYDALIPSDDTLVERFERHLAEKPSDFASLRKKDRA